MSKKFLKLTSLVMAIVMMMSMIGLQVSATDAEVLTETQYSSEYSDTTYTCYLDSQGVAYVLATDEAGEAYVYVDEYTYQTITVTDVVIPTSVIIEGKEYDVTAIGAGAFYDTDIVSVVIPDTVVIINTSAFIHCADLETVEFIGESVTTIGSAAFQNCTSLVNFVMPNSVTTLDSNVFNGCSSLETITLSESLVSASYSPLFSGCTSLTSLIIPDSLTSYGVNFMGITNLTYFKMGSGVTSIDGGSLSGLTNLETLILGEGLTLIRGGSCGSSTILKNLTITASVETIEAGSFSSSYAVENIYYTGTQEQWEALVAANPSATGGNGTLGDVIGGTNTDVVVQCCAGHTVEDYLTFVSTTATADTAGVSTYLCECGHTVEVAADALGSEEETSPIDFITNIVEFFQSMIEQIVSFFRSFGDMF